MQLEKFVWTGVAIGAALCIGTAPIAAKPGGAKPPTAPKMTTTKVSSPKPTTHGSPKIATQTSKTHVSGPKTTHAQAPKVKSTTPGQPGMPGGKNASTTTTKTHGNPHTQPANSTTTGGTTTAGTTTVGTTTTTTPVPLNKAQQHLTKNTNMQTKLQTRLGSQLPPNVTIIQAASGFKNLGQFVAAVNVSNNLGIPFADLKAKMTGMTVDGKPITTTTGGTTTTAPTTMSLGQAIQSLKGMDSTTATETANTATTQANAEISSTTTNPKKTHH